MYYDHVQDDEKDKDTKTENYEVAGSPYWMAPETIQNNAVTPACDIWAVGATAIELYTGSPPYSHLQPMSAMYRIVQDQHPLIPEGVTADFKDFLLKCFAKEAWRRPTARQLLAHKWLVDIEETSL